MMWLSLFFSFLFLTLKDSLFLNTFTHIEGSSMFMSCVIFCLVSMLMFFKFNKLGSFEVLSYESLFFIILNLVLISFLCNSTFFFLLFLELCVFPMSYLIVNFSKDLDKYISVVFMFSINIMGSIPFLYLCYFNSNANPCEFISSFMFSSSLLYSSSTILFCFLLVLLSKLPLMFFHFWLTKAHVSASGSCSMVLAGLMLKLGSFGLYKFFLLFMFCYSLFLNVFVSVSLFSCVFFCLVMLRFFDLKYLVACSSILHMSLIFPLVCSGTSEGVISSLFMMTGHGLVSFYLFFLVSMLYEFSLNRSVDFNKSIESFSKTSSLFLFFFVFMNLGFPPLINFYSEMIFCLSLYSISNISLSLFLFSMTLGIIFTMFLVTKMIFGKKSFFSTLDSESSINGFSMKMVFMLVLLPFLY